MTMLHEQANPLQPLLEAKRLIEQTESQATLLAGQLEQMHSENERLIQDLSELANRLISVEATLRLSGKPIPVETPLITAARAAAVQAHGNDFDKAMYLRARGWIQNAQQHAHGWWGNPKTGETDIVFATAVQRQVARDSEPFKLLLKEQKVA